MGNMREISIEECKAVFGGHNSVYDTRSYRNIPMFNADDIIIVTGQRYESLSDKMWSFGGMAGYDTVASFAAGDFVYDEVQATLKRILNAIFGLELKTDAERQANEEKIASEFNPDDVIAEGKAGDMTTWSTKDGKIYVDTNKNGKPDLELKFDRGGALWGNDGSGWKRI